MASGGRFFALGSSDSSSDDDSSSSSSGSEAGGVGGDRETTAAPARRWDYASESSDSDDDERVVRSARDKKVEAMIKECTKLSSSIKESNWIAVQDDLNNLNKALDKANDLVKSEGVPYYYIRALVEVEDAIKATTKAMTRKFSRTNNTAFNRVRQNMKKNMKQFEEKMEEWRKNPVEPAGNPTGVAVDDSGSGSDTDSGTDSTTSTSGTDTDTDTSTSGDSGTEDEMVAFRVSDDDSSDGSEDVVEEELTGRARWVIRKSDVRLEKPRCKVTNCERFAEKGSDMCRRHSKERDGSDGESAPESDVDKPSAASKKPVDDVVLTLELLQARLQEIAAMRGRKNSNAKELVAALRNLIERGRHLPVLKLIPARMQLISCAFGTVARTIDAHMDRAMWLMCIDEMVEILEALDANPDMRLGTVSAADRAEAMTVGRKKAAEAAAAAAERAAAIARGEVVEEAKEEAKDDDEDRDENVIVVIGDIGLILSRLSEEYGKALLQTDSYARGYVDRISDEQFLVALSHRVSKYFVRTGDFPAASLASLLHIEYSYYKMEKVAQALHASFLVRFAKERALKAHRAARKDAALAAMRAARMARAAEAAKLAKKEDGSEETKGPEVSAEMLAAAASAPKSIEDVDLDEGFTFDPTTVKIDEPDFAASLATEVKFQFVHGDARSKIRAMLFQIFNHAIHDRFYEARDLLLMSKLQTTIDDTDVPCKVLFNRTMAQLGLCAFRAGMIYEAHSCLSDLCSKGHTKELLAQDVSYRKPDDRNAEQERMERRRLVAPHLHINLDLLEASHLTSAMLLEVPNMAASEYELHRREISWKYRKLRQRQDEEEFSGPPASTKGIIIRAGAALAEGSWRKCLTDITSLPVWSQWEGGAKRVTDMLSTQIRSVALKTFMHTYSSHYVSLSHDELCSMFDMDSNTVHAIVSKLISNDGIHAAWDQPSSTLVMHRAEPSRLQTLALRFADKVADFVKSNELMLEARVGTSSFHKDDRDYRGGQGGRRGYDNRGGGRWRSGGGGGSGGGGRDYGDRRRYNNRGRGRGSSSGRRHR